MGGAMISGWTSSNDGQKPMVEADNLLIVDPKPSLAAQAVIDNGAFYHPKLQHAVTTAEYVLLAIKPQSFSAAGPELALCLPEKCVVISIMAGISLKRLGEAFPNQRCVRAMPNTPASIGKGMTGYVCAESLSSGQKKHVGSLLSAGGTATELDNEGLIDTVTAISGSGPAYFFHMVEAMAAAGASLGLSEDQSQAFARQTLIGAGALLDQSGQSAAELRQAVTSPNGTTQAALDVLMSEQGLPRIMRDAVLAAYHRSRELGKEG